jgi:type VI secretion system secreted protein VgrG
MHWEKAQEITPGKVTLWDHCFELPHKHLEGSEPIQESVTVGEETHKLRVADNDKLEVYDYPGGYAQRFDGISKGGGEQPAEIQKIFQDNKRTASIRAQQEAITIRGISNLRHLCSGHKFTLERHFDADGDYVLTTVDHNAYLRAYRSGRDGDFEYQTSFSCIPLALPFRPPRRTPRPTVRGTQTAVVVGPPGQEIFTDKYGRVKVQFHWDREGKADADSSCWVRVAQTASGQQWGSFYLPRIGHEVIVDFLEGDPDQPIIVGSVFNAAELPPYRLPNEMTKTVLFKSKTIHGSGFNEIRIEDNPGSEQIFIHAQKNQDINVRNDQMVSIGHDSHLTIGNDQIEKVKGDKHQEVDGDLNEKISGSVSLTTSGDQLEKISRRYALETGTEIHLKAGIKVVVEAGTQISLKVGGNFVDISPAGVTIQGTMVLINSGGAAGSGSGSSPDVPKKSVAAATAESGRVSKATASPAPMKPVTYSPAARVMQQAAQTGAPFCEICARLGQ